MKIIKNQKSFIENLLTIIRNLFIIIINQKSIIYIFKVTIALANQKGGVGKTTTAHALGFGLHSLGASVLMVDTDPQCNLSSVCGLDSTEELATLYDVFKGECSISDTIHQIRIDGLDLVPSDLLLSGMDAESAGDLDAPYMLRERLESVADSYDYCILDTSPWLGILTTQALVASDFVIIPICPDYFSIKGLLQLHANIQKIQRRANSDLRVSGLLLTRCDRTNLTSIVKDNAQKMATKMGTIVFESMIRQGVSVRESQLMQNSIFEEAPRSAAAKDYRCFIGEFLRKEGVSNGDKQGAGAVTT